MILCTACALLLAACRSSPHYNPAKSHHTEDGFRNNYAQPPRQSFWKWQWERFFVMKHGETRKLDFLMSASADEAAQPERAAR